jgi:hypothetical protein
MTEFFTTGQKIFTHSRFLYDNGKLRPMEELTENEIKIIVEKLRNDPRASKAFNYMQCVGITSLKGKLDHFVDCNFGNLDNIPDIDESDRFNYEHIDCPNRSTCQHKGKICLK